MIGQLNIRVFLLFIVVLFVAFSEVYAQTSTTKSPAKIGMILPLSGPYAALGTDNQQGIDIAKSEIDPAINIDFIFADSRGEAATAVVEFKKLLDLNQVIGILFFRGPVGMALNPLSKSSKLPLLGGISNKDFALSNEYAFQLWPRSDVEGEAQASALKDKGFSRIALVSAQDDYTIALSSGLKNEAKRLNLTLVYDEEILPTETDFRILITNIKRSQPDVIVMNVGLTQIAPLISQLRQQGLNIPALSTFFAGKKEVAIAAGKAAEGLMYIEISTNLKKLRADLKARFESTPSGATLSAYVGTIMIAQALKGLNDPNSASFYARLASIKEIQTLNGAFAVKDRVVQFPLVLRGIKNGLPEDF